MNLETTFLKALDCYDASEFDDAILLLKDMLEFRHDNLHDYPWEEVYVLLGGVYYELDNHVDSINFYKKALQINESLEMASLGLYLSYVSLHQIDKAIEELVRFLKDNKADLYLTTLEELVEGLEHGYGLKYEKTIEKLVREHVVPNSLDDATGTTKPAK